MNLKQQVQTLKIELESLNKTLTENKYEESFKMLPIVLTDVEKLVNVLSETEDK